MRRAGRVVGAVSLGLVAVMAAAILLPPVAWPDAAASAWLTPYIANARTSVFGHAFTMPLPLHLRFAGARCRRDGGVLLFFEQYEPPYLETRHACTNHGRRSPQVGGGGYGLTDLADDPEIAAFLGSDEIPCE